jgi:hypothetical protein
VTVKGWLAWIRAARSSGLIPTLVRIPVPSYGLRDPGRRVRLIAVAPIRDEMPVLPAFLRNVGSQVDGIVVYDDGSSDGSGNWLAAQPDVLEVLRAPPDRVRWDERRLTPALVEAALRHGADWILWTEADLRLERDFRARAERVIRRGRRLGYSAYSLTLRELWDSPDRYRADGVWGEKQRALLFRARADHAFDDRELHSTHAPLQAKILNVFPRANLLAYHLGMIGKPDREERRRKYESLDPEARWQPRSGYAYLTDEQGLELRKVPRSRRYSE